MADAVAGFLQPGPDKCFLDGTLGGGGHAEILLGKGARVIGLDRDEEALRFAGERLAGFGDRFQAVLGNFRDLPDVLPVDARRPFDGIVLDLGVSSRQLDEAERGFSFAKDGPLDMRMGRAGELTAEEVVNESEASELVRIFREFGEEPAARKVAAAIVRERAKAPITTTGRLAEVVESVLPRRGRLHPATRVFQGLRIAVNDELGALDEFLGVAPGLLRSGGRLAVIAFHSLEDRRVKVFMNRCSRAEIDRPEWPAPRPNPDHCLRLVTRKPREPEPEEARTNPRSRSARLRVAEKI